MNSLGLYKLVHCYQLIHILNQLTSTFWCPGLKTYCEKVKAFKRLPDTPVYHQCIYDLTVQYLTDLRELCKMHTWLNRNLGNPNVHRFLILHFIKSPLWTTARIDEFWKSTPAIEWVVVPQPRTAMLTCTPQTRYLRGTGYHLFLKSFIYLKPSI